MDKLKYNDISARYTTQGIELSTMHNGYYKHMHYIGYDTEDFESYDDMMQYLMDMFIKHCTT